MRTLKLTLSYDGSEFYGWQIQPNVPTVQGALVDTLQKITCEKIRLYGAGRTDAGVHALGQVAHCKTRTRIPPENLLRALNSLLPPSIRVLKVDEWSSLVNPERPIPFWVRRLTGIKNEEVRRAPRFKELLPRLLDELEDALLVAHHARFDVDCLNSEISRVLEQRLTNRYLCTVELARRFLPESENYRLETLSQWLQLSHERPHRAGSDARATAELFCHLLRKAEASWSDYLRPRPTPAAKEERAQTAETG